MFLGHFQSPVDPPSVAVFVKRVLGSATAMNNQQRSVPGSGHINAINMLMSGDECPSGEVAVSRAVGQVGSGGAAPED